VTWLVAASGGGAAAASAVGSFARLRQLHLDQQALQGSLDNIPAPIFVKDAQGSYIECNQAFQNCLGLREDDVLARLGGDEFALVVSSRGDMQALFIDGALRRPARARSPRTGRNGLTPSLTRTAQRSAPSPGANPKTPAPATGRRHRAPPRP
jgi:PAS domain-containing protein